ncbi:unnamed protein product [Cyclocybe aegerita]|uniref:Uncharacterized protein n=1 Tax=Cyclocybe aegerita TaxID=1973307 RepID=A0A8S0W8Y1_CYCAE|nr:unnamed protein product [Cyclocybe aegerita]
MMQPPTCQGLRIRSTNDALVVFHGVALGMLHMVTRRLDTDERRAISSGCVYVWEERGPNAEATGLGIERWTDSIQWGPSRVRDEFLFYHERRPTQPDVDSLTSDSDSTTPTIRRAYSRPSLIKQTYSVFVDTHRGRRKWHLIAYFTQETLDQLYTIDNHPLHPGLASLRVPAGMYTSARSSKTRPKEPLSYLDSLSPVYPQVERAVPQRPPHYARNFDILAPLEYLKTLPPPRRHLVDEMQLNSLSATFVPDQFSPTCLLSGNSRVSW